MKTNSLIDFHYTKAVEGWEDRVVQATLSAGFDSVPGIEATNNETERIQRWFVAGSSLNPDVSGLEGLKPRVKAHHCNEVNTHQQQSHTCSALSHLIEL